MTTDERLDHIYDAINALMWLEAWSAIDAMIASCPFETDDERLAVLTATLPAKSHLRMRPVFFGVKQFFMWCNGKDGESILKGLE